MNRLAVGGIVALLLAGCSSTEGLQGAELFQSVCATCHGADGGGIVGPPIGPGSNAALMLDDTQIGNAIRIGPGAMPAFETRLAAEQVESLVAFVRELQED